MKFNGKKITSFLLVLSITTSTFYMPVFTPRANALLGVFDFGFDLEDVAKFVVDAIAVSTAQLLVDEIVKETVTWANTGFEGGPAYVTDTQKYFENTADGIVGEYILGRDLGFLCSPFQNDIRLSLQRAYTQPVQKRFQCTLTGVTDNIEDFYKGNFEKAGGWNSFFVATQSPTNNPYGAYLDAQIELNSRVINKLGIEQQQLDWNQGFKSLAECSAYNPSELVIQAYQSGDYKNPSKQSGKSPEVADAYRKALLIQSGNIPYDGSKPAGACIKDGPVKTAGTTIKNQLDDVLGSSLGRLVRVEHVEQLIGAFASGVLQRFVFGPKGFFGTESSSSYSREVIDIDGDDIPDGYDTDDDKQLDICHHGLKEPNLPYDDPRSTPGNENCLGSRDAKDSPYFVPMCEKLPKTIKAIDTYLEFVNRNNFKKEQSNTWLNKTINTSSAVEDLITTIGQYSDPNYDEVLFTLGEYTKRLDKTIGSLAKDEDLRGIRFKPGDSDSANRDRIVRSSRDTTKYLKDFQVEIDRCDNPDTSGLGDLDKPNFDPIEEEGVNESDGAEGVQRENPEVSE